MTLTSAATLQYNNTQMNLIIVYLGGPKKSPPSPTVSAMPPSSRSYEPTLNTAIPGDERVIPASPLAMAGAYAS